MQVEARTVESTRRWVEPAEHEEDRLSMLLVEDVMNANPEVIRLGATVREAADRVRAAKCSDLMVVTDDGAFVGVLSEGDLLRRVLPTFAELAGKQLADASSLVAVKARELAEQPIAPLVIRKPLTLGPKDTLVRTASVLIARQIRLLPVVDERGRLVGTIGRSDVGQALLGSTPSGG
jgi:CBS domain-containing protein